MLSKIASKINYHIYFPHRLKSLANLYLNNIFKLIAWSEFRPTKIHGSGSEKFSMLIYILPHYYPGRMAVIKATLSPPILIMLRLGHD